MRIEGTVATLAPELKVIAPVRGWAMGRDEEIAYARKHGIPVKGGTETPPYSIDDNLWGRSSEGKLDRGPLHAPDDDVFQLVTRPEEAPDEPEIVEIELRGGRARSRSNGERLGIVELLERAAEIGMRHGVGIVDHIEDRIVGLKVRDIYEVPAAAILLPAHAELERLVGTIHQNQFKPRHRPAVGLPRLRRPVVGAAAHGPRRLHRRRQRAGDRHDRAEAVQGPRPASSRARRPTPSTTRSSRRSRVRRRCSPSRPRPGFIELWSLQSRLAYRLRRARGGVASRPWATSSSASSSGTAAKLVVRRKARSAASRDAIVAIAGVVGVAIAGALIAGSRSSRRADRASAHKPSARVRSVPAVNDPDNVVDPVVLAERRARRAELAEEELRELLREAELGAATLKGRLAAVEGELATARAQRDALAADLARREKELIASQPARARRAGAALRGADARGARPRPGRGASWTSCGCGWSPPSSARRC